MAQVTFNSAKILHATNSIDAVPTHIREKAEFTLRRLDHYFD